VLGYAPPVKGVLSDASIFSILTFNNVTIFSEFFIDFNSLGQFFNLRITAVERLDSGFNIPGNYDISAFTAFRY
jgi:hypothetical protein